MANRYPLLYAQTAEAVARSVNPDALLVMRSGVAGIQRYQRAVWAGDQRMTWDRGSGFPAVIPAGLSWGIAQAPFWGSDFGGYLEGRPPLSRAAQEELYLRWVEFGALSPIMRDTLGDKGHQAIYMDSDARTLDTFRLYAQMHQQLFPYLYSAAHTAHLSGLPIMRALVLAYPQDRQVYGLDDEYLLGPDLLVAPVTVQGARTRAVYLPGGTWVDYWSGAQLAGGRWVTVAAPLERIPLFVRGGALLPLLAAPGDTLAPAADPAVQRAGDALLVRLYPGGYGDSVVLADGTRLADAADAGGVTLRIAGTRTRFYRVELPLDRVPVAVLLDGHAVPHRAVGVRATAPGWSDATVGAGVQMTITVQAASGQLRVVGAGFPGKSRGG
jgi:alpha-D-xyloside xylohydrolase